MRLGGWEGRDGLGRIGWEGRKKRGEGIEERILDERKGEERSRV